MINLDFADVKSVMSGMGHAIMGTGKWCSTAMYMLSSSSELFRVLMWLQWYDYVMVFCCYVVIGVSEGADRAAKAANDAMNNPLLGMSGRYV